MVIVAVLDDGVGQEALAELLDQAARGVRVLGLDRAADGLPDGDVADRAEAQGRQRALDGRHPADRRSRGGGGPRRARRSCTAAIVAPRHRAAAIMRPCRPATRRTSGPRCARSPRRSGPGSWTTVAAESAAAAGACPSRAPPARRAPAACRSSAAWSPAASRRRARSATNPGSGPRRPGPARRREPELELGVGEDDPPRLGVRRGPRVDGQGEVAGRLRHVATDSSTASSKEMFSSWTPTAALVEGVKIGVGQLVGLPQPGGQAQAVHRPRLPVLLPRRAGQVAPDDALDRQHLAARARA